MSQCKNNNRNNDSNKSLSGKLVYNTIPGTYIRINFNFTNFNNNNITNNNNISNT